jgi:hypothetical protein
MKLARLKELLAAGTITQEEFDTLSPNAEPDDTPETTEQPETTEPETTDTTDQTEPTIDYEKLDKIIQARVDKVTAKLGKEKADLQRQLKREREARLSDDELKQLEMAEKEKALEEREKALTERQNREYAQKSLREAGLDDGSETAFALVDFVMGADETEIDSKVKSFKELFNKAVTAAVNKRFKDNAYTPKKSDNLNGGKNPFAKEQWNVTEQMRIAVEDPALAAQLEKAAGNKQ